MDSDAMRRPVWTLRRARTTAAGLSAVAVCALGLAVASFASAAPSRKGGTQTRSFSTGSFAVYCTSSGQLCSPPEKLTFTLPRRGTLTSITYTTAATHCSSVLLHVLRNGHEVAKTGQLPSGQQTERLTTHIPLPKGATTLGFVAQGFIGGCNVGRVVSWGGTVTVSVKFPR
jgi:hypothetical protein